MFYVNPFSLLDIQSENLTDFDAPTIRKAKRKLLAEIELSDNDTIDHNGKKLTKSDCSRVIDDLDDKDKKEFHFFIYQNKDLNRFLSTGDLGFFKYFKIESIYNLSEFITFISPYFSQKYNELLSTNFRKNNVAQVKLILSVKPIVNGSHLENCYKSTYATLKEIEKDINRITADIESKKSHFIEDDFEGLPEHLKQTVNIELINLLPSYFQSLRNQIAQSFRSLATDINNDPHNVYKPAYEIIAVANSVLTDGLIKQKITKGYYIIKGNYENSIPHYQPLTDSESVEINIEQKEDVVKINNEETKESNNPAYWVFLCSALAIGFFYSPAQKLILGLSLSVPVIIQILLYRDQGFSKDLYSKSNLLFIAAATLGLFYPIIAQLFIAYSFFGYFTILCDSFINKPEKLKKRFGFYHYLVGALFVTFLYNNDFSSHNNAVTAAQAETTNAKDTITTSVDTITSSTNNDDPVTLDYEIEDVLPVAPELVYSYPYIKNGNITGCSNMKARYNKRIKNKLIISCGSNADVAVKLINKLTEKTIRYVYIHKNSSYSIRNIPEGKYYLKIAYGNDWGVQGGKSNCEGRFTTNTMFKKGEDVLNYNLIYSGDGYQIPSYSLNLDVIFTEDEMDKFQTDYIEETEFYNE